jgi:ubiquinone/menaquinone biosynthesis C-methylase UbiE
MDERTDPQMELMFSFYERLHRKAPGSESTTRKALSLLAGIPANPEVVDFGCGSGAAAIVLAQAGAKVTAVDIHQPFLDQLEARAANAGVTGRITTVCADMAEPPFPDDSFDLVWSEGAVYLVGFEEGLKRWRRLLRTGGHVAVTEATWLCERPPRKAIEFWMAEYPAITTVEGNLAMVKSAGFEPVAQFPLPKEDWSNYYEPLIDQLGLFRSENEGNADAKAFADDLQREINLWEECGDSYGYVFYLARA